MVGRERQRLRWGERERGGSVGETTKGGIISVIQTGTRLTDYLHWLESSDICHDKVAMVTFGLSYSNPLHLGQM